MCACLLCLTGVNFFVYPQVKDKIEQCKNTAQGQETPGGEESSNTGTGVNIQEEYVHDFHLPHHFILADNIVKYGTPTEEKYAAVHYELTAPPPDL